MELPPRGTGLATGRAGERRYASPRTEEERYARHYQTLQTNNTWSHACIAIGTALILLGIYLHKTAT